MFWFNLFPQLTYKTVPGSVFYAFDLGYTNWLYLVVLTVCLNPEEFRAFKLVKRTQLSHNVAKFRFELPTPTSVLGLPIGQHISCRFGWLNYSYMPVVFGLCSHQFLLLIVKETFGFLLHAQSIRGKDSQGEEVVKPYTPTTLDSDIGYFELVIKVNFLGSMVISLLPFPISYWWFWWFVFCEFTDVSPRKDVTSFPGNACGWLYGSEGT